MAGVLNNNVCGCLNGGRCIDAEQAICECNNGFEGSRCETIFIDFVGKKKEEEEENNVYLIIFIATMFVCILALIAFFIWRRCRSVQKHKTSIKVVCPSSTKTKRQVTFAGKSDHENKLLGQESRLEGKELAEGSRKSGVVVIYLDDTNSLSIHQPTVNVDSNQLTDLLSLENENRLVDVDELSGRKRRQGLSF